ncbi:GNAT family N-acetyltransferase [Granulicella sp. WH15]|uniref:GNAT family N-acetyltransferase n=1 Tax=Granulicella sp. WH15 TaxID=2602070 RepID=UPI0013A58417|nr:GNAT family N-acetyltransferase [Granulicella sp. WH15]
MRFLDPQAAETRDGITLRPYRESDVEAMYALDQVCFSENFRFDRRSMRRFADAPNAMSVVAYAQDGSLAGFSIAHLEHREDDIYGYVVTLDVAPEARGKGLAGKLLGALEERARGAGAGRMELHVAVENPGAIRFYERSGYVLAGRLNGFYGPGLDGLGYWKRLG